jgi:hypothetical protein
LTNRVCFGEVCNFTELHHHHFTSTLFVVTLDLQK